MLRAPLCIACDARSPCECPRGDGEAPHCPHTCHDDALAAPRGIVNGIVIGAAFWLAMILVGVVW